MVLEEEKSDRPDSQERINSGLYKMKMIDIVLEDQEIHTAERGKKFYNVDLDARKPYFVAIEQQTLRPTCASAKSDHCLFYSLYEKFNILASLCS